MEKRNPDYAVSTPVTVEGIGGGKTYWTRLGIGFENTDKGGKTTSISIRLNGNPINGELVLFPWSGAEGAVQN